MFRAALEANASYVQAHLDQQLALLKTSEVTGYDLPALAASAKAHVEKLLEATK